MKEFQFHPIADAFPLMDTEEMAELLADVEENGVIQPIVIYEGKILDGRNRYRAAKMAKLRSVPTVPYEGDDAIGFAISANLRRRHLTADQIALAAAELANMRQGHRSDLSSYKERSTAAISQKQAAKKLGVSYARVQRAAAVKKKAKPAVVKAVREGRMTVGAAEKTIDKKPKAEVASLDDARHAREAVALVDQVREHLFAIKDLEKRKRAVRLVEKKLADVYRDTNQREMGLI